MRIGFIHRTTRPDTWGHYWMWTLRRRFPEHELVECLERCGANHYRYVRADCDMYLHVEDGEWYEPPPEYRPLVVVVSDTHIEEIREQTIVPWVRVADYVFYAQQDGREALGSALTPGRHCWLPHAAYFLCDMKKGLEERRIPICAVMNLTRHPLFEERNAIAELLRGRYGQRAFVVQGPIFEDMALLYSRSLIVWNYSIRSELNMRCFEAAGCGACLVTNDCRNLLDVFGQSAVAYSCQKDMFEQIDRLLDEPRQTMARGHALRKIAGRHTYLHRITKMFEVLYDAGIIESAPKKRPAAQAQAAGSSDG